MRNHITILLLLFVLTWTTGCTKLRKIAAVILEDDSTEAQFVDDDEDPQDEVAESFPDPTAPTDLTDPTDPDSAPLDQPAEGTEVVIYDHGLDVPRTRVTLPPRWKVKQDIASDPDTGEARRYLLDYYGPNGELVRCTPLANYLGPLGQKFGPMWRQRANLALRGVLDDARIGRLQKSPTLASTPAIVTASRTMRIDPLEASIEGTRQGEPFSGVAYVAKIPFPGEGNSGSFVVNVVVAPREHVDDAVAGMLAIARSDRPTAEFMKRNEEIGQRIRQRSQNAMARSQREHQQRMRNNQAQFDAHQQRMRANSQAFDQRNQAWLQDFRGSGGAQGGDTYDSHDYLIDSIHEQDSFADPSSGQRVTRDGQYKYNYSDGQGNYVGTDDPNLNTGDLQGDWEAVDPLVPGDGE